MKTQIDNFLHSRLEKNPDLRELYHTIKKDLDKVEKQLESISDSPNKLISDVATYLFQKKGKRVRPALLILCSKLYDYQGNEDIRLSAVVEIIHTASLIHDDIIDKSMIRRGKKTVHAKWGPNITVLLGDYLYITSIGLALKNKYKHIIELLTETSAQMIEGEITEYCMSGNIEISEQEYFDIIDKKTASLFSVTCQIGGILGQAPEKEENFLADYGTNLGMSFQIIDDLLNYAGDEKILGKPVLSDLKEGRITLPLIYTLNNDSRTNRERIKEMLNSRNFKNEFQEEILNIIRSNGALDYSYQKAKEYAEKCKEIISHLPESVQRDALYQFSDFIITRRK